MTTSSKRMKNRSRFNTKLSSYTHSMNETSVFFVDANPGSGKTHQFVELALDHVRNKTNSVLVYAAPTDKLLDEVQKLLLDRGLKPKTDVQRLRPIPGMRIQDAFQATLVKHDSADIDVVAPGTILLCSHECVAKASEDTKGKDRVVLVYDEARACLETGHSMKIPEQVYSYLLTAHRVRTVTGKFRNLPLITPRVVNSEQSKDGVSTVELAIWQWTHRRVPLPELSEVKALLPQSNHQESHAKKILEFLEYVHSSSVDVYVTVKQDKKTNEYKISKVYNPARMFEGYSKVLILSAFFETSQMYHFLRDSEDDPELRTPVKVRPLTDRYESFIDPERQRQHMERLKKVKITYIFDLGNRSLTKTDMSVGIVLNDSKLRAPVFTLQKSLAESWKAQFPNGRAPSYRSAVEQLDENNALVAPRATQKGASVLRPILPAVVSSSVVRYMVETSTRIHQAWIKTVGQAASNNQVWGIEVSKLAKLRKEKLPVGVNAKMKIDGAKEPTATWEAENLSDFPTITKLPMVCHGRNKWKSFHSASFLATMQYSQQDADFLKGVAPQYDPRIDRTVDFALQVLFRCNARVVESEDPCLFIVTDKMIARTLHDRFVAIAAGLGVANPQRVLEVVDPSFFVPGRKHAVLRYDPQRTAEQQRTQNARRKTSIKGMQDAQLRKVYAATVDGLNYNRLTTAISRLKKAGKGFSKEYNERAALTSFAKWKRTPEGIKAAQALVKV